VVLLLDNYDSFTFNLYDYLLQLDVDVLVVRNDELTLDELIKKNITALVISPGPGRPEKSGILMQILNYYAMKIPILGICLGHQAIGIHFGAELTKAPVPMHGKVSKISTNNHIMWSEIDKEHLVCRYHSLALSLPLPEMLQVTAKSDDGLVMALVHNELPIWGLQYHPEAILTENGMSLLKNWVKLIYLQPKKENIYGIEN
jgi:anthranilate synthase/aminodeoxychorismate synthase-like glutamine amidotransferase